MGGSKNKSGYFDKLKSLLETYKSVFIVTVDNVSSQQMHEVRQSLRGEAVVLMGKNTMVSQNRRYQATIARRVALLCPVLLASALFILTLACLL